MLNKVNVRLISSLENHTGFVFIHTVAVNAAFTDDLFFRPLTGLRLY